MTNADGLEREARVLTAASHRPHDPKFGPVFKHGQGARLWDAEGLEYIDFTCGYSVTNFGHSFPPLVAAATQQLQSLTHLTQEPHVQRAPLAEKLVRFCGFEVGEAKVHFNSTGARAIETAWKAAFAHRPGQLVSLAPSYHGRSLATSEMSETSLAIGDFIAPNLHHRRPASDYGYCAACPLHLQFPACKTACCDPLIEYLEMNGERVSAVIVEPALGARGYVFPPAEYWLRLREATRRQGITLIADEIQMGLGRTGANLLSVSQGWQPDMVVLGKSLGGGIVPISAVIGHREILDALPPGSDSETFACTPLAAAVATEVLHQLESVDWIQRGAKIGERLRTELLKLADQFSIQVAVEGQGAVAVAEFLGKGRDLAAAQSTARALAERCIKHRLLVHFSGPYQTRIVLIPPFTATENEIGEGIERLGNAFRELCEHLEIQSRNYG